LTEVSQKATTSAQPQISEKSRPIEVLLPDERYQETSLLFKVPVWDNLAASANRLLKFEFPPKREVKVYERLIKTNGLSSGLSKKVLESLPVSWLETIYRDLWQSFCGESDSPVNNWLSLFLLIEEFEEFELSQWVVEDIRLLGERTTGEGGLIVLDSHGRVGYARNSATMAHAFMMDDMPAPFAGI